MVCGGEKGTGWGERSRLECWRASTETVAQSAVPRNACATAEKSARVAVRSVSAESLCRRNTRCEISLANILAWQSGRAHASGPSRLGGVSGANGAMRNVICERRGGNAGPSRAHSAR